MKPDLSQIKKRIETLEKALKPFARAFEAGDHLTDRSDRAIAMRSFVGTYHFAAAHEALSLPPTEGEA